MRLALFSRLCIAGFLFVSPFLLGADGCNLGEVTVITRIEPNGRFYRSIRQLRDHALPPEALTKPKTYPPSTQPDDYTLKPEWAARWAESQPALAIQENEPALISAANTFATAADIPRNYQLIDWPLDDRTSTNQIVHTYTDYILFGIDDWSETITETVLLYEYAETADEMLRQFLPALEATTDEVFGSEYDFTELKTWLRDQAATAARRFALLRYQIATEPNGKEDSPENIRRYCDIVAPAGLDLPLNDKGEIDDERASASLREFFQNLLETRVSSKTTGRHLTTDEAKMLAKKLNLDFPPSSQPATADAPATSAVSPDTQPTEDQAAPWNSTWQELFEKNFSRINGETLEAAAFRWGAFTGGANRSGPIQFYDPYSPGARQFNFTLECAGPIFETNGLLETSNTTRWQFTSSNLWPNGYRMHAAAVRWNHDAERKLFDKPIQIDIDTALKLKDAIASRQPVKDALQQSVKQGNLDPLRDLAVGDNDDAKAARDILALTSRPAP